MSDRLVTDREIEGLLRRLKRLEDRLDRGMPEVPLYATGTWTPAFGGTTTDGTMTYSIQQGRYTRIGDLCVARFNIRTATVTAVPTGNLQITLPLTAATVANAGPGPSAMADYSSLNLNAGYTQVGVRAVSASTRATLAQSGDNLGAIFIPGSAMTGAIVEVVGMLIYEVA